MVKMSDTVLTAIITGMISLIGTIITIVATNSKTRTEMRISMAEMRKDIQYLGAETAKHNNFAQRMPVVEEQIKVINHRIDDLERKEN